MSISVRSFHHQEKQVYPEKKQKIDHGIEGSGSKDMDLVAFKNKEDSLIQIGGKTFLILSVGWPSKKNVPDLQEKKEEEQIQVVGPSAAQHILGEETKNVPDLQETACKNCGKVGDHLTKDCRSGFYGRMRKYDQNTILFRNLSEGTCGEDLEWLCLDYGPVPRSVGPDTEGMGDGGLVAFENREDAQMAIEKLNGSTFNGRVISVEWAMKPDIPKSKCRKCGKIGGHLENDCPNVDFASMVKHIHKTIQVRNFTDSSDISSLCRTFGLVAHVFQPGLHYKDKGHLGLMVAFEKKGDAGNAIKHLNGSCVNGRVLEVDWAAKSSPLKA